jgi:hypothetical protein
MVIRKPLIVKDMAEIGHRVGVGYMVLLPVLFYFHFMAIRIKEVVKNEFLFCIKKQGCCKIISYSFYCRGIACNLRYKEYGFYLATFPAI